MAITKEEREILGGFNDTGVEFPGDKTIPQLFAEQVAKTPGNTAVIFKNEELSYKELDERTGQLAGLLQSKGVGPGSIAAIMVERSFEMMIGLLAILKAGAAYLPIDPHYPEERIQYMLADSSAKVLLSGVKNAIKVNEAVEVIDPGSASFEFPLEKGGGGPKGRGGSASAASLAYIIYTSGSTGKPKGVMVEHRSVVNRLHWMQGKYPLNEKDVILQKTPYFFDVSVWELFWWLFAGAAVCFLLPGFEKFPQAIVETVEKNNITTMHFVPSMMSAFLGYIENSGDAQRMGSLKRVFCSGEELKPSHIQRFNKTLYKKNGTHLINLYGPTEATVDVSYFDCPPGEDIEQVPIGKPIDNTGLHIVDKEMQLQPIGTEGELCISGTGLARGYLNRPNLTKEKFCLRRAGGSFEKPPPAPPQNFCLNNQKFLRGVQGGSFFKMSPPGRRRHRLYKTGDLAYWLVDGNIVYCGRMDHQVKIRGLRIELGEIESVLLRHPSVRDCIVIVKQTTETIINLIAYMVTKPEAGETAIGELKKYMKSVLPDYMVPGEFVILEALPLTPSGKVDRKALG